MIVSESTTADTRVVTSHYVPDPIDKLCALEEIRQLKPRAGYRRNIQHHDLLEDRSFAHIAASEATARRDRLPIPSAVPPSSSQTGVNMSR